MPNRVTLLDVAAHAGVSRATASLVLRGTGRVSAQTRKRVTDSMAALGYVYQRGAASLRTQHANVIGVMVTSVANPLYAELLLGLEAELADAGYVTLLSNTTGDLNRQDQLITAFWEQQVSGLALAPATGSDNRLVDRLDKWGVPYVFMTHALKGPNAPYIGADDVRGGHIAAEHLLFHRCRRIAYFGGPGKAQPRKDRVRGVKKALAEAGVSPTTLIDIPGGTSTDDIHERSIRLLAQNPPPDGVVCHTDTLALSFLRALRDFDPRAKLPVIGYENIASAALWEPPLTTVSVNAEELGRQAGGLLLKRMSDPTALAQDIRTRPSLVVRRSCGCTPGR